MSFHKKCARNENALIFLMELNVLSQIPFDVMVCFVCDVGDKITEKHSWAPMKQKLAEK